MGNLEANRDCWYNSVILGTLDVGVHVNSDVIILLHTCTFEKSHLQ